MQFHLSFWGKNNFSTLEILESFSDSFTMNKYITNTILTHVLITYLKISYSIIVQVAKLGQIVLMIKFD